MEEFIGGMIIDKLTRDIGKSAASLNKSELRFLVDLYYQMQSYRIATNNQSAALVRADSQEPHATLDFFVRQFNKLETTLKTALDKYVQSDTMGQWLTSIIGIGPVIAAGLLSYIDIEKCQTAGAIWRFAGLDPTMEWGKGQKRPWNAKLKTLCWKLGESFVKQSGNPNDTYGKIYLARKEYETEQNEAGAYAAQAKAKLEKYNIGKTTEAYKHYSAGKLPPGHLNARAKRYAVKIFLSHLFDVWYWVHWDKEPPKPFAIAIQGHAHMFNPPNFANGQIILPDR